MQVHPDLPPNPDGIDYLEFARILAPYVAVRSVVRGSSVLDVGCRFGYGAWALAASGAERVVAVDIDEVSLSRASSVGTTFHNCSAVAMDAQTLGFKEHEFQVVTCFEVIEHVPRPQRLLTELSRQLSADGVLLLTTPKRCVRLLPLQRPWNRQHLREYTLGAFQRALRKHFESHVVLGIRGQPTAHQLYRRKWRQDPVDVYFGWMGWIVRALAPEIIWRSVVTPLRRRHSSPGPWPEANPVNTAMGALNPKAWPFYVADVSQDCLNFLAICGPDDEAVWRVVSKVKRLA